MKRIYILGAVLTTFMGCTSSSDSIVVRNDDGTTTTATITKESIERCWIQVGFEGDLYKFITPEEAAGLTRVGGASEGQVAAFKACLATG